MVTVYLHSEGNNFLFIYHKKISFNHLFQSRMKSLHQL